MHAGMCQHGGRKPNCICYRSHRSLLEPKMQTPVAARDCKTNGHEHQFTWPSMAGTTAGIWDFGA